MSSSLTSSTLQAFLGLPPEQWWHKPHVQILEDVLASGSDVLAGKLLAVYPTFLKDLGAYGSSRMLENSEQVMHPHFSSLHGVHALTTLYQQYASGVVANPSNMSNVLHANLKDNKVLQQQILSQALWVQKAELLGPLFEHVFANPYPLDPMRAPMDASIRKVIKEKEWDWTLNEDQVITGIQLWSSSTRNMQLANASVARALVYMIDHVPEMLDIAYVYQKIHMFPLENPDGEKLVRLFQAKEDKHKMLKVVGSKLGGVGKKM